MDSRWLALNQGRVIAFHWLHPHSLAYVIERHKPSIGGKNKSRSDPANAGSGPPSRCKHIAHQRGTKASDFRL